MAGWSSHTTYLIQLVHHKRGVIEGPNLLVALAIHNGHSLQTHGLHGRLWREQESVVQITEELLPVVVGRMGSHDIGRIHTLGMCVM